MQMVQVQSLVRELGSYMPCAVVNETDDGSRVRCCKEQYCIGTWNVRSVNQGKLEVVKQEVAQY